MTILPIENINQIERNSCWLAVCAQVIKYRTRRSVRLPDLLTAIMDTPQIRGGSLVEIRQLLKIYGINSAIMRNVQKEDLIYYIEHDKTPVILDMINSGEIHHAILLRGFVDNELSGKKDWLVNDPIYGNGVSMLVSRDDVYAKYLANIITIL